MLRGYVLWALFVLSVLLGSLSFGVIVHVINSGDFDIVSHLQGNLATSAVMMLPYFWLLFLVIFAAVAYFNWKSTKLGYRFKRRWIVLGSVALSMFIGSIFYALGMAKKVDNLMTKNLPIYNQTKHDARRELWLQPENGLLTGKIIGIDEVNEKLLVVDETGKDWVVDDDGAGGENTQLEIKGKIVKVIGERRGEKDFRAKEIRRCGNCQDDEENDDNKKDDDDVDIEISRYGKADSNIEKSDDRSEREDSSRD